MVRSTLARSSGAGEIVSEERRWSWVVVLLIATLMVTSVRASLASPSVSAPSSNSFPNASALASDLGLLPARSAPAPAASPDATACNYTATFNETGLPSGATWDIIINGATMTATVSSSSPPTGTSITFSALCVGTYSFAVSSPSGYVAIPPSGNVTVPVGVAPGSEVYQEITFATAPPCSYTATFNETGLPLGATWDMISNGATVSATVTATGGTSLTISGVCYATVTPFAVSSPPGYAANPSSGYFTFMPSTPPPPGAEAYFTIAFSPIGPPCNYTATFNESGLAVGATWDIILNGATMNATVTAAGGGLSITLSGLCVGEYTFTVSSPPGYVAAPPSGTITVGGTLAPASEVYQPIVFRPTSECADTATFNETGLPPGASWDVTLNGVTITVTVTASGAGTTITFSGLCVGQYPFTVSSPPGYAANPSSAVIVVPAALAAGSEVYVPILFTPVTPPCNYTITFNESGLPPGTVWDVTLNGVTLATTVTTTGGTTITFSGVCVGQYWFSVSYPAGYTGRPGSQVIVVPAGLAAGSEVYVPVPFFTLILPCTYTATFNETGLPPGTSWDITLNGTTMTVTVPASGGNTTLTFSGLCAAGYTFTVSSPPGYAANPASGTVTVAVGTASGSEVYQTITFTPVSPPCTYTVTFNETGLPPGASWDITLNGVTMTVTATASGAGTTLTFTGLCVGQYQFVVSTPPGYIATPPAGTIVVPAALAPGSEVYQPVHFTSAPCHYSVTFNETGLPELAIWDITLNGTTFKATVALFIGRTITFTGLCAGVYKFSVSVPKGYFATPLSGTVNIPANLPAGAEVYQVITFVNLTFIGRGLPPGVPWDVTIVGKGGAPQTISTSTTLIGFSVPRGSYRFTISKPLEYSAKPLIGTTATGKIVVVTFSLLTKFVTFKEKGLPAGTTWGVMLTGPQPDYPFAITTMTYAATAPAKIAVTTVSGNYSWLALNATSSSAVYHPTTDTMSGTFSIVVTGDAIKKVPPANPIAIVFQGEVSAGLKSGCFYFADNGTPLTTFQCNVDADDIEVSFVNTSASDAGSVCAVQFTLGGAADGPPDLCLAGANEMEVTWTGAPSYVITSCTWLKSGVPIGACTLPAPAPDGFVFGAAQIVSAGLSFHGVPIPPFALAPPNADQADFEFH